MPAKKKAAPIISLYILEHYSMMKPLISWFIVILLAHQSTGMVQLLFGNRHTWQSSDRQDNAQ
jgi:hypothetical protein